MRSLADSYTDATTRGAVTSRSGRGLIQVTGGDRQAWLHNLVTNTVKTLAPGQGVYAFACDVRGRIQFDMNILVRRDAVWIDVPPGIEPAALAHFNRYLIMEDATLSPHPMGRVGVVGPSAATVAESLGIPNLAEIPQLSHAEIEAEAARSLIVQAPIADSAGPIVLMRHDFSGLLGFELFTRSEAVTACSAAIQERFALPVIECEVVDLLRIEAGIPWFGRDIDDKTLPADTGQLDRAVSFKKGCYLGQEVIERMRSHGSMAKRLAKLRVAAGGALTLPAPIFRDPAGDVAPIAESPKPPAAEVGRLTSLASRPIDVDCIGLGYLRTTIADNASLIVGAPPRAVHLR